MPRTTHPRSRHRHDRGHVRYHRDRIVVKRGRQYRDQKFPWAGFVDGTMHPIDVERIYGPWGYLEKEQMWFGCHTARCGLCSLGADEARRERRRQDRAWRKDWDVL